jgi:hypothetical protein
MRSLHGRSTFTAFALTLLAIGIFSRPVAGETRDIDALVADLPRGFVGDFRWDGDRVIQNVAIRFKAVRRIDAEHAEALGCGNYNMPGTITSIAVRMQVTLPGLEIEIWESAPDRANFVTDGSHRGRLSQDLGAIDAEWTTLSSGQHGRLQLHAAPAAQCAPADAT